MNEPNWVATCDLGFDPTRISVWVLLVWAIMNLLIFGVIFVRTLYSKKRPTQYFFSLMNVMWAVINGLIAGAAILGGPVSSFKAVEQIYLINVILNFAYILIGVALLWLRKNKDFFGKLKNREALFTGFGWGIIFQGAVLQMIDLPTYLYVIDLVAKGCIVIGGDLPL